jgi:hypothetical protein
MSAPTRVRGYDVIPTSPAKNWFVCDPTRPYNQTAMVMIVGWYDTEKDDGRYLASSFSTEDDLDKLRKLRDGLTEIIECKLEHRL